MTPDDMSCAEFVEHLLPHLDGELDEALGAAASRHESACSGCADRVRLERAFESRLDAALGSDGDAARVLVALRTAQADVSRETVSRETTVAAAPVLRPFSWVRGLVAAAAAVFVVVQGAWFFCIPPFECSYLQAVEKVVDVADVAVPCEDCPESERLAALVPPERLGGDFERVEGPVVAPLALRDVPEAVRVRYRSDDATITAVWSDPDGHLPSFRRRVERDGNVWWVADEDGRVIVAWMCPATDTLCSLVSDLPEERLLAVAETVRGGAH